MSFLWNANHGKGAGAPDWFIWNSQEETPPTPDQVRRERYLSIRNAPAAGIRGGDQGSNAGGVTAGQLIHATVAFKDGFESHRERVLRERRQRPIAPGRPTALTWAAKGIPAGRRPSTPPEERALRDREKKLEAQARREEGETDSKGFNAKGDFVVKLTDEVEPELHHRVAGALGYGSGHRAYHRFILGKGSSKKSRKQRRRSSAGIVSTTSSALKNFGGSGFQQCMVWPQKETPARLQLASSIGYGPNHVAYYKKTLPPRPKWWGDPALEKQRWRRTINSKSASSAPSPVPAGCKSDVMGASSRERVFGGNLPTRQQARLAAARQAVADAEAQEAAASRAAALQVARA